MSALDQLRQQINEVDEGIIKRLAERQTLVQAIGQLKADQGVEIVDLKREQELSEFHRQLGITYSLSPEFVANLFRMIILESRKVQRHS